MEFTIKCPDCGKLYVEDLPEGNTASWEKCECGAVFCEAVLVEPFGHPFLYGIEAIRRKRHTNACIQFAISFEVFEKQFVEALLNNAGVSRELSRFVVYDMELSRGKYSQLAGHLMHSKPGYPDVSLRNFAVHRGKIPERGKIVELAENVLNQFSLWIDGAKKTLGADYYRLLNARAAFESLPNDVGSYDRTIFDMTITTFTLRSLWADFLAEH